MTKNPIRRALFSVSDKTGLLEFGHFLAARGVEILSTGGTAKALREAGIKVVEVSDHTGMPEMLDGRVKTLHPAIHGGLLGIRGNAEHEAAMAKHKIAPIDLLVVNLYPFEETVAGGADFAVCVENIDIGGPALIRGAAKNHDSVTVVVDVEDYAVVMAEMTDRAGATSPELRKRLAAIAYARTGAYDAAISRWFSGQVEETFPRRMVVAGTLRQSLRYGENPHQHAALYASSETAPSVVRARQIQGKELSYNNLNDTNAAFDLVAEFEPPAVAIIKHANPCGVAVGPDILSAYQAALACDPVCAFGGIVAVNRRLDKAAAEEIRKLFTEVVIAPEADEDAIAAFASKKNLRLLLSGGLVSPSGTGTEIRTLGGGFLAQTRDNGRIQRTDLKVVTKRAPSESELLDLLMAFRICKHVKSNAIVYVKNGVTVGIGAGQMSRVDSCRIAAWKAGEKAIGSAVASDAFFPFADGLLAAAEAGATSVIQPGGSVRDEEVIAAADEKGMAMVLTGMRHFRH